MINKLVEKTIKGSLWVQFLTTGVSMHGLTLPLKPQDEILKSILVIETVVQFVEGFFYMWVINALKDMKLMTPRRYIDWTITTPIMLFSTILFFKYSELKENNILEPFTVKEFYQDNKDNVHKIFIYNGLMLLFGYLGETNVIHKSISIPIGFIFFYLSFKLIYEEYAHKSELGKKLFSILLVLWALYGISATFPIISKNISYNTLDIFAKNFYGLYIYYKIMELQNN